MQSQRCIRIRDSEFRYPKYDFSISFPGGYGDILEVMSNLSKFQTDGRTQMIASGVIIEPNEKSQWFIARGINFDTRSNLQPENAIIGIDMKAKELNPNTISYQCAEMSLVGEKKIVLEQNEMGKSWYAEQEHRYPVVFSAEFSPILDEYSWASMEYFVSVIYNPLNYIKVRIHSHR